MTEEQLEVQSFIERWQLMHDLLTALAIVCFVVAVIAAGWLIFRRWEER